MAALRAAIVVGTCALMAACSETPGGVGPLDDGGSDSGAVVPSDAGPNSTDAGPADGGDGGGTIEDSGVDGGLAPDAGPDAGTDAGPDAGPDASGLDAGSDDASADAGADGGGADAGEDAGRAEDAGVDAGAIYAMGLAGAPSGVAMLVWEQDFGDKREVRAHRFYPDGGGSFGPAVTIRTLQRTDGGRPICCTQVAIDPAGNATVVSEVWNQGYAALSAQLYNSALDTWSDAGLVSGDQSPDPWPLGLDDWFGNAGMSWSHALAADGLGNVVVAWSHIDAGREIWVNRSARDAGWAEPRLLDSPADAAIGTPVVAADGVGVSTVVWAHGRFLLASRCGVDGGCDAPVVVQGVDASATASQWPAYPKAAASPGGDVFVTWQEATYPSAIMGAALRGYAGWQTPTRLSSLDAGVFGYVQWPSAAIDPNGNAISVWQQQTGTGLMFWERWMMADGGISSSPTYLGTVSDAGNFASTTSAEVAVDSSGNAVVIWQTFNWVAMVSSVRGIQYDANTGIWGAELILSPEDAHSYGPLVVADSVGRVLVVWIEATGEFEERFMWTRYRPGIGWSDAGAVE